MAKTKADFDWHITQALDHTNRAINISLGNHDVALTPAEKTMLEEVQHRLEIVASRG